MGEGNQQKLIALHGHVLQVLAICGDGGFMMNCQEMETARRLNSNITVMVWEDGVSRDPESRYQPGCFV